MGLTKPQLCALRSRHPNRIGKVLYVHVTDNIRVKKLSLVFALQLLAAHLAFAGMSGALCGERGLHRRARGVDGPHGWFVLAKGSIGCRACKPNRS